MNIKKHFLFVVFNDPLVVGAIHFLSSALYGSSSPSRPHMTIQGPFEERPTLAKIQSIRKRLVDDVFLIGNPGVFRTRNGCALYLSARSRNLIKVWDKPDFPVEKFGFNPHVTLYEGSDSKRVERALAFLMRHRVELLCRDFDVVQYVPKQADLFPNSGAIPDESAMAKLASVGRTSSSFSAQFLAAINGSG